MHRIDTRGHINGTFSDGNPNDPTGESGTIIDAAWLNGIQESLARLIESAGLSLEKGDFSILEKAIEKKTKSDSGFWTPRVLVKPPSGAVFRDFSGMYSVSGNMVHASASFGLKGFRTEDSMIFPVVFSLPVIPFPFGGTKNKLCGTVNMGVSDVKHAHELKKFHVVHDGVSGTGGIDTQSAGVFVFSAEKISTVDLVFSAVFQYWLGLG